MSATIPLTMLALWSTLAASSELLPCACTWSKNGPQAAKAKKASSHAW